jgi:nucleotide-binding universal stress UspA family protein
MIGCAFDGSAEAAVALQCATQLAGRLAAHVQIIGVHQPLSFGNVSVSGPFGYQAANDALRVSLNNALDEARLGVDPSAEATTLLLDGPVAATLIAHSARLDLLVTGSRGYGPVRRVFAGSVSRALVREASCPVIVVPRPETDHALA